MATSSSEPQSPGDSGEPVNPNETVAVPGAGGPWSPGNETVAVPGAGGTDSPYGPDPISNETVAAAPGWTPPSQPGAYQGGAYQGGPTGPSWQPPGTGTGPGPRSDPFPGQVPPGQSPYGYVTSNPPPGYGPPGSNPTPGGDSRGSRTLLLGGIVAGVAVLAVLAVILLVVRSDDDETATGGGDDTTTGSSPDDGSTGADGSSSTETTVNDRIGQTVGGVDLRSGDCIQFDPAAASIPTFDVTGCDASHVAEVTGLIEHPQAGQAYPGADELRRFGDDCYPVTDDYLGVDSFQTGLVAYHLTPDETDWEAGMFRVACVVSNVDFAPLNASVEDNGDFYPRGEDVPVIRLAIGDCFGPLDPNAEILSVGIADSVQLLPCDEHHPGFFFGRSVLHEFPTDAPWPGDEEIDLASDTVCDVQFTRWFGVGTDAGFKYRFWRPTEDTWTQGERSVYCLVADDRGLPPDLDFADWVPVVDQPVGTCFVFPPDTEYDTLDSNLHVNDVPCDAYHHGEVFGTGDLPEGPFPADVVTDTNVACEDHFVDYVGRASDGSYYQSYVFWTPLEETWSEAGGRGYSCSLLAVLPIQGSAAGTNK